MDHSDIYYTISTPSTALFKDKGSKFIGYAYPISNEEEVKQHLDELKKEHHNARHHCYAFRLGTDGENYRFSDDGEPSGTAGRPIHGQLLSKNITNTLVIVVRYFGGTLLGVGGLINAYKCATADVLENCEIKECIIFSNLQINFDYSLQNIVMRKLDEFEAKVINSVYEMDCTLCVGIPKSNKSQFLKSFDEVHGIKFSEC